MERNFYNDDFERFLRRNANNFRMSAPEKIWSNISKELGRRRRRINYALTAFFLITIATGYYFISSYDGGVKPTTAVQTVAKKVTVKPADKSIAPVNKNFGSETVNETAIAEIENQFKTPTTSRQQKRTSVANYASELVHPIRVPEPIDLQQATAMKSEVTTTVSENETNKTAEEKPTAADVTRVDVETDASSELEQAPFTAESVTNSYSSTGKKLSWQLSFTPTISYRKLGENKSYLRNSSPFSAPLNVAALYNVNNAVTHKPDLGFEIGVNSKYKLSQSIKLLAGLQFNVNRYDIKAFSAPYSMATIQLNSPTGVSSVNTVTSYSNTTGYRSNWLQNFYFQVSVPVGMELKLAGDDKTQLGISGTVQPTYLIGDRAYLITSDYKNYAQVPWLVRRWNANTSLQTFVSYYTGKVKWQVGPQVRYQLLSSFISKYPVKENLFDFGMRVGVNLSKD